MKTFIKISTVLLLSLIINTQISAQRIGDLNGINYQAVAIDEDGKEIVGMDIKGKPLFEKEIGVKFSILKGNDGAIQYQETHTTLTDQYGLFSLIIGHGTQTGSGAYSDLLSMPWIDADQWLKVEISIRNDGNFKVVSLQQFMSVPYSFYTDDIADDAITTEKILNETILTEDIATGAIDSRTILDETILNEDVSTGAIDTRTILNETILAEDIATGAVTTVEILNETILAEDIATGAVTTNEILNETILAEDIATGAVTTTEILNETILAEDIATGAVTTSEILNETILAEDIATGAVTTNEILNETILAEDIATGAVTTSEILNETILAEDIATGAVTTNEILNGTILNEDIADGTIDLTGKVTGILPVTNGGTGLDGSLVTDGQLLIGNSTSGDYDLANLTPGTGIAITNTPGGIQISSGVQGINSVTAGAINVGYADNNCPGGRTLGNAVSWISPDITLEGAQLGNIVVASLNYPLGGCMMTTSVEGENTIKVVIYNGTGDNVCFDTDSELRILLVQ